jgi:uncharacterized protein
VGESVRGLDGDLEVLAADHVLEYPYSRSVGPVLSHFFTALRDGRVEGVRGDAGKVIVPPTEYDPLSASRTSEPVGVSDAGVVTTWTWVSEPEANQPLDRPFAFALILLDGADTAMLHAVDAGDETQMATGMRVRARWRQERVGHINDIVCFAPDGGPS